MIIKAAPSSRKLVEKIQMQTNMNGQSHSLVVGLLLVILVCAIIGVIARVFLQSSSRERQIQSALRDARAQRGTRQGLTADDAIQLDTLRLPLHSIQTSDNEATAIPLPVYDPADPLPIYKTKSEHDLQAILPSVMPRADNTVAADGVYVPGEETAAIPRPAIASRIGQPEEADITSLYEGS